MAGLEPRGPVALDTNCLSYLLVGQDADRQRKMNAAIQEAAGHGVQFSTLALAELLVEPVKYGLARLDSMYNAVANSESMAPIVLDVPTARLAAEIRGLHGLRLPDAVVIACAVAGGADVLLSNDRQVVRVASEYLRAVFFDDWQP